MPTTTPPKKAPTAGRKAASPKTTKRALEFPTEDESSPRTVWFCLSNREFEAIGTAALSARVTMTDYAVSRIERTVESGGLPAGTLAPLPDPSIQNMVFPLELDTWRKAWHQAHKLGITLHEFCRRVRGHKELGALAAALGRAGSAASSLRSSSAPPSRPSAGENSELASESGFSYRLSISQPAEILTI